MEIHSTGDWHFEQAKHRRADGPDAQDYGWHDAAAAFDQMVDALVAGSGPRVLVFLGDLARDRKPTPHTYAHVAAGFARLHAEGIPVVMTPGNHDIAADGEANALEPLAKLPGVHLFNEPGIAYLYDTGDTVQVHRTAELTGYAAAIVLQPWTPRGVAAVNVPADANMTTDELLEAMGAAVFSVIRGKVIEARAAAPDAKVYVGYHGTITGATTCDGRPVHLFREPLVSEQDLADLGVAGVMAAHIHKRQTFGTDATPIAYCSSLVQLSYDDAGEEKGWLRWPAEGGRPEPMNVSTRQLLRITEWPPPQGLHDLADAVVRVDLTNFDSPEPVPSAAAITRHLEAAGVHAVNRIQLEAADEKLVADESDTVLTAPLVALVEWLRDTHPDMSEQHQMLILRRGAVMLGVEIDADGTELREAYAAVHGTTNEPALAN